MSRVVLRLCLTLGTAATSSAQVNLPPGFEVVEFAVDDYYTGRADINDCGQIAFDKFLGPDRSFAEIFLYDNGHIAQITDNRNSDVGPNINGFGQILWARGFGSKSVSQVVLYDGGRETIIDDFKKGFNGRSLNNLGHVAWSRSQRWRRCPMKENIFIWDGVSKRQVTFDEEVSNVHASLNDHGDYAWARAWWCEQPWVSEIRLTSDGEERVIPSPGIQNQSQKLSNSGWIVWSSSADIALWDGSQTRIVAAWGSVPHLNDRGRVYSALWDFSDRNEWQPWIFDVHDPDIRSYRLADSPYSYSRGFVNNWGEASCVWYVDPPNSEWAGGVLFLRRTRTGDSEFDGDVDLADFAVFVGTMIGPVRMDSLCESRFLDIDHDGDLDLADYARFQNAFTSGIP